MNFDVELVNECLFQNFCFTSIPMACLEQQMMPICAAIWLPGVLSALLFELLSHMITTFLDVQACALISIVAVKWEHQKRHPNTISDV